MPMFYSPTDSRNYRLELEIVETSQDIANNQTTISYWLFLRALGSFYFQDFTSTISLIIDGVSLLNTTTQRVSLPSANSVTLLTSGTRVINHATDGTKSLPFSASFRTNSTTTFTPIPTHTISNTIVLTTIPRASQPTLDVSTQALGSAIIIETNRANSNFTHIIKYVFGNQNGTIATGVGESTTWILPNELANAIPNNTSGSGTITCETYSSGVLIGTKTVSFTATVPNNTTFQPSASISSILEGASGLSGFTVFIQNKSQLRVQSSEGGQFGATISQRRVTIDGVHYLGADITSALINNSGTIVVTLRVTDSRGYFTEVTQNVTLVAYFSPKINSFSASRSPTDQDTNLSAPINFEIAPVSNQNARYYRVRYRVVGGSWVVLFDSTSYYSRTFTHTGSGVLNANNSYEIELLVQDSFTTIIQTVTVTTAFDLLNFNQSGKGMAIGKVSENANGLEIALPTDFTSAPTINGQPIESGPEGPMGPSGPQGPTGPTGPQGPIGNTGATGLQGTQGIQGNPGISPVVTRTSSTSNTVGTGSKTFSYASATIGWVIGNRIRVANSTSNWMEGVITAVSSTSVTLTVDLIGGSGTYTSWSLALTGEQGATGPQGATGATGPQGPQGPTGPAGDSGSIIEYGSNSNGSYIKFSDGTMIQFRGALNSPTIAANIDTDILVTFPATFVSVQSSHVSVWPQSSWNGVFIKGQISSTVGAQVRVANGPAVQIFTVSYIAIGRWKV